MRTNYKRLLKNLITLAFILMLWQLSSAMIGKPVYYPSFTQTLASFCRLASQTHFWMMTAASLLRVIGGFLSALLIGVVLAFVAYLFPIVSDFIKAAMGVAKATPVASFIILAMIWMRTAYVPVFVAVLMIAPILFENTLYGIKSVEGQIIEMSRVYKIPTLTYLGKIVVPYTMPYLSAAIFSSLGIGFKAVVSAEILSHPIMGIGTDIYNAKIYLETPELFALTITVIVLSYMLEKLIVKLISAKKDVIGAQVSNEAGV